MCVKMGVMKNVTGEDGGRMKRGMETVTPTAVTSTRAAVRLLSLRGGEKRSTEGFLVQSSDNIHLHLSIINKISKHFYELSPNSHNSSTQTGQQNE